MIVKVIVKVKVKLNHCTLSLLNTEHGRGQPRAHVGALQMPHFTLGFSLEVREGHGNVKADLQ